MELNLLEKTELKIYGLKLEAVNLNKVAAVVAGVLVLPVDKVLVVDVRHDHICLDILSKSIDINHVAGKEGVLLRALACVEGLELTEDAFIDSSGILGLIGCEESEAKILTQRAETMVGEIERTVLSRALVYATGFEVQESMIEDTNSPYLIGLLANKGYQAAFGGILPDDVSILTYKLRDAAERGFGLVITTGGVGAEDKDFSVEALTKIDPDAATPYITKFTQGTGRHVKDGVRISVGQYGLTTFVTLPGPHDEVVAAGAVLINHCNIGRINKTALANDVARVLRDKLKHKHLHHQKYH